MALHFGSGHPLAHIAADHCANHSEPQVGGVACGQCWELTIRDDEKFAVENDLPRDLTADAVAFAGGGSR